MSHEYQPDALFLPAAALLDFAKREGTPFYLYNATGIENSVQRVKTAFAWSPGYENYVPIRENPNPAILELLYRSGSGVTASNGLELRLAQNCGFSGRRLLYAPTRRDSESETFARALNAVWLIHSRNLLPEAPVPVIYLRFLPDGRGADPIVRRRLDRIKAGFSEAQLREVLPELAQWDGTEVGLALYTTSYSLREGMLAQRWTRLSRVARILEQETGVSIRRFYLGEGPGLPYRPNVEGTTLEREAEALQVVASHSAETFTTGICKQVLEPHGMLVTSVLERRTIYRNFLVVNAGISQYLRPALRQAYRHISLAGKTKLENRRLWQVVGATDDELDRFSDGRMLPEPQLGDLCVVHDVGCGGRCFPMLSLGHGVAPEYLWLSDGTFRPISPQRSASDVWTFLYGDL